MKTQCILCLIMLLLLTGCRSNLSVEHEIKEEIEIYQLLPPKEGDKVVVVETTYGTIRFKLFEEEAPQSIAYFENLIENEAYKESSFDRIEREGFNQIDCYLTSPDDNLDKTPYVWELVPQLKNIYGAVSILYQNPYYQTPSFSFVLGSDIPEEKLVKMESIGEDYYTEDVIEAYRKVGGFPNYDGRFTVIGQVYEGLEVLEEINGVDLIPASFGENFFSPSEEIKIEKIYIETYK